jgi:hypothetical protein
MTVDVKSCGQVSNSSENEYQSCKIIVYFVEILFKEILGNGIENGL